MFHPYHPLQFFFQCAFFACFVAFFTDVEEEVESHEGRERRRIKAEAREAAQKEAAGGGGTSGAGAEVAVKPFEKGFLSAGQTRMQMLADKLIPEPVTPKVSPKDDDDWE